MWQSFKNIYNFNQEIMFLEVCSGNNQEITQKYLFKDVYHWII